MILARVGVVRNTKNAVGNDAGNFHNNLVGNGLARSSNKHQKINNLSIIVGLYKAMVTKQINFINIIYLNGKNYFTIILYATVKIILKVEVQAGLNPTE